MLEENYYCELSAEREQHIAALAGCSVETAKEWIYYGWPNAHEHYLWLQNAEDEIIADWIAYCRQQ